MDVSALLLDGFDRVAGVVHRVLDGVVPDHLAYRADAEANSIAWLVWHLTRVQDDHVAAAFGRDQVWRTEGWAARFDLPFDESEIGYGQTSAEVGQVQADATLLRGYFDATHAQTRSLLEGVRAHDLDRVVDEHWDPPVTLGVRLVSVISDDLQHAGQAAFVRGLAERLPAA